MPHSLLKIIASTRTPPGVTLLANQVHDCIDVFNDIYKKRIGVVTRREIDDTDGNIRNRVLEIAAQDPGETA